LSVFDISRKERLRPAAELGLNGYSLQFGKAGKLGALASADFGVYLVDLSDPRSPRRLSSILPAESSLAVSVAGEKLYVACGSAGLFAYDVSRPDAPVLSYHLSTPGPARGLASKDSILYVMCGDSGVLAVDRANPSHRFRFDWPGAVAMAVRESFAAVACGWYGVLLVDVADPVQPVVSGYVALTGYVRDVALGSGRMSVAVWPNRAFGYDVTQPASPVLLDSISVPGYTADVAAQGDTAWVLSSDGLHSVDVRRSPAADLGFCPLSRTGAGVALGRGWAAVALGADSLGVVSTADAYNPKLIVTLALPDSATAVAAQDSWAFVGMADSSVAVVSLAAPSQPAVVASLHGPAPVTDISVNRDVLGVAAGENGLFFIDVGDPRAPALQSTCLLPGRTNGVSVGGRLVAACGSDGLFLVVRGVGAPFVLTQAPLVAAGRDVVLGDTLCYVATDWAGVVAFNVQYPSFPWVTGYYGGATICGAVARCGSDVLMADDYSGIARARLLPAAGIRETAPTEAPDLARVAAVSVPPSISVLARSVRSPALVSLLDPAGRNLMELRFEPDGEWQAVDFPAFPLGAGTYFVRVQSGSYARVYRTELIR
jgi:hypothetical protein